MENRYKKYIKNLKKVSEKLEKLPLNQVDEDVELLKKSFDIAYKKDCFRLYDYDKEIQDKLKLKLFSKFTKYSASLTFLGIQILAANTIMSKNNFKRKEFYFDKKCGIAINHLRSTQTYVNAKKCKDGYKLNGILTWASGYKIFDHLLVGFHFDGNEMEVLTKFEQTKGFYIGETPRTFVGQSLNTVNIELKDYFVKEEDVVSSNPIGNYSKNKSLSKTVHYAFYGLGLGALEHINNETLKNDSKKKLKMIKKEFLNSTDPDELDKIRVRLFNLLQKIITLSMIVDGGKSILKSKTLQRYYRELVMFNANGLNDKLKNLFLEDYFK
ncbi:hypothetical protein [Halarcobacter anaerophilus]|jgi:hypothetical protein|uniref:hypothetical protein n=1 Tax=Halarcobacter anaerophilus TaxID=877500 RepID=UPI0005C8DD57|nr:hypothetical protein [Halarcobacter anaerophilus]